MRDTRSVLVLSAAVILLSHSSYLHSNDAAAPDNPQSKKPDSLKPSDPAPTFVLRNIVTGDAVYLRDYTGKTLRRGSKNKEHQVVVLSFWATWCEPCKKEIPILTKIADDFKDKPVKFFLVNTMEQTERPTSTEDSVKDVLRERGYTLPCLVDALGMAAQAYQVHSLPMLVVIGKDGTIQKINRGFEEGFEVNMTNFLNRLTKQ